MATSRAFQLTDQPAESGVSPAGRADCSIDAAGVTVRSRHSGQIHFPWSRISGIRRPNGHGRFDWLYVQVLRGEWTAEIPVASRDQSEAVIAVIARHRPDLVETAAA